MSEKYLSTVWHSGPVLLSFIFLLTIFSASAFSKRAVQCYFHLFSSLYIFRHKHFVRNAVQHEFVHVRSAFPKRAGTCPSGRPLRQGKAFRAWFRAVSGRPRILPSLRRPVSL